MHQLKNYGAKMLSDRAFLTRLKTKSASTNPVKGWFHHTNRLITLIASFLIIILVFRVFFFFENKLKYHDGQFLSFETYLLSQPKISGRTQRMTVFLDSGQRIFITIPLFPQINYGDRVSVSGKLNIRVLKNSNNFYSMNFPKIEAKNDNKNFILAITGLIRQKIISVFQSNLPPNSSGLLLGIVFGIKETIPQHFYDTLRVSGTLHVTAASGMNVTMVGGFFALFFSSFLRRQIAIFAAILGILFYAVLAGLEASIVRASIMGILVFSSQILGRQNAAAYALLLTGYFMLLFDPNLIFDLGFQLSFAATAGLLFIMPLFSFRNLLVGSDLATTLSAQIAVLPILLSNFGSYSLFSILANTLVLWSIPLIMVLGGLAALFGFILEPLSSLFLYLSFPLLLYFEKTVSYFASFGQTSLNLSSWSFIVGYYMIIIAVVLFKRRDMK